MGDCNYKLTVVEGREIFEGGVADKFCNNCPLNVSLTLCCYFYLPHHKRQRDYLKHSLQFNSEEVRNYWSKNIPLKSRSSRCRVFEIGYSRELRVVVSVDSEMKQGNVCWLWKGKFKFRGGWWHSANGEIRSQGPNICLDCHLKVIKPMKTL